MHSTVTCLLLCNEHNLTLMLVFSLHIVSLFMAYINQGGLYFLLQSEIPFSKHEVNPVLLLEQKENLSFGSLHFNNMVL